MAIHRIGNCVFNTERRELRVGDAVRKIGGLEYRILVALLESPEQQLESDALVEMFNVSLQHVRTAVSQIRKCAGDADVVENVRGWGYQISTDTAKRGRGTPTASMAAWEGRSGLQIYISHEAAEYDEVRSLARVLQGWGFYDVWLTSPQDVGSDDLDDVVNAIRHASVVLLAIGKRRGVAWSIGVGVGAAVACGVEMIAVLMPGAARGDKLSDTLQATMLKEISGRDINEKSVRNCGLIAELHRREMSSGASRHLDEISRLTAKALEDESPPRLPGRDQEKALEELKEWVAREFTDDDRITLDKFERTVRRATIRQAVSGHARLNTPHRAAQFLRYVCRGFDSRYSRDFNRLVLEARNARAHDYQILREFCVTGMVVGSRRTSKSRRSVSAT